MKTESLRVLMLYPRQFANLALTLTWALTCLLLISLTAMAQTPAPPQQPDQQTTPRPAPESPPIPERSIGLEPGKVVRWMRRDAVMQALENNVDLQIERTNVRMAQWEVVAAQGAYDPVTRSGIGYNTNTVPNINRFTGAGTAESIVTNTYQYSLGFEQLIQKTGGFFQIDFLNDRSSNNRDQLALNYSPSLAFEITQPIFKNFKIDNNRNRIKVLKKQLDMSDAQFRRRVLEIITDVETAYWNLYVAYEGERIARQSLTLAEKQLKDNQRQVEVGTLAPIDVTQAATQVEGRRTDVYAAMNQVAQAENALKLLTVEGPKSDLWKTKIETIEKFEVQQHELPLDDAMRLAIENRYELKRFNLQKEWNQYDIEYWRNQAKPQIDFIANYGLGGVGGTPRIDTAPNCSPVDVNGQPTCLSLAPMVGPGGIPFAGVNQTPFEIQSSRAQIDDKFVGGYGTSLRNLFSNDFRRWSVGLQFSLPLRNRVAKANLASAREAEKQTELLIRQQMQLIEQEVRNAVQSVDTARQRIESTRRQTEFANDQLEGEQKKLQAGLGEVFLVLTRQNELVQAQVAENRAKADYAVAVANLSRIVAMTPSNYNIEMPDPKQPMK